MKIKFLEEADICNYKKTSMFIGFPICTFKCDFESNTQICQNWHLRKEPDIEISTEEIVRRYLNNPLSEAIVCGGFEPFETGWDVLDLLQKLRERKCLDDFVIYTGYTEEELNRFYGVVGDSYKEIIKYPNVIIKFGRFVPNQNHIFDKVLGVELASDNQYAKVFNKMR